MNSRRVYDDDGDNDGNDIDDIKNREIQIR